MPRTDSASLVIEAPPEMVYAAFVDPDALQTWLPPSGMVGKLERFELCPGGSYRMVLTYHDAPAAGGKTTSDSDVVEAHFVDIVPGVRITWSVDFVSDDPVYADPMTMTWEMTELDGATRVDVTADNVPDVVSPEDHAAGLTSSLVNLAHYLEA